MQVPKTQGFEGSWGLPGPAEGERLEELQSFHFLENYKELLRKRCHHPPTLCRLVSLPLHPPGTLGTVTIAPRSLNAHPKKKIEIGVLKLLEIHVILHHFNIFCDPIMRFSLAPAGVRAQSAHGVFVQTGQYLSRYCRPYVC